MAMGKKRDAVSRLRGHNLFVYPITDPDTPVIDTAGNWKNLGYFEKADLIVDVEFEPVFNGAGKKINAVEGNEDCKIVGILKQSDKDLLDFLGNDSRGNYYAVLLEGGTVDGNYQDVVAAICKIKPGFDLSDDVKQPAIEIHILDNEADVTITTETGLPATTNIGAASVTVDAHKGYEIVETAVA